MNIIKFKNNTNYENVWCGMAIQPNEQYQPQTTEIDRWTNDTRVLQSILSQELILIVDNNEILNPNEAINFIKGKAINIVSFPFPNKTTPNGLKIFLRKHGIKCDVSPNGVTEIIYSIPYDICKIDKIEIVGCNFGDTCDLIILDTPQGSISGVPNFRLNQFAFSVNLPEGLYEEQSKYDADLRKNLQILIKYYNSKDTIKSVGINFTLHELKQ